MNTNPTGLAEQHRENVIRFMLTRKANLPFIVLGVCLFMVLGSGALAEEPNGEQRSTFTLWQLPSRTPSQNMSYVLRSCRGRIIVIDGGNKGDAEYLRGFLAPLGNHVNAWFVSHPHPDHVDALTLKQAKAC